MPPEGESGGATGAAQGGSGAPTGQGGTTGAPAAPPRVFVGGRWMTAEEMATAMARAEQEKAELQGRLSVLEQQRVAPPAATPLPDWVTDALDKGVPEAVVRNLLAAQQQSSAPIDVRDVVRDELTSITKQAKQAMSAADRAKAEYVGDNPDFDESEMNQILSSDPVVKDGYDTFYQQGKFYQAMDYAWKSRLSKGRAVNQRGRSAADVPPSRRLVQQREGTEGEGTPIARPRIPDDVIANAQIGGEDAIKEYMRHRRKGTALDLEAEPPVGWRGR